MSGIKKAIKELESEDDVLALLDSLLKQKVRLSSKDKISSLLLEKIGALTQGVKSTKDLLPEPYKMSNLWVIVVDSYSIRLRLAMALNSARIRTVLDEDVLVSEINGKDSPLDWSTTSDLSAMVASSVSRAQDHQAILICRPEVSSALDPEIGTIRLYVKARRDGHIPDSTRVQLFLDDLRHQCFEEVDTSRYPHLDVSELMFQEVGNDGALEFRVDQLTEIIAWFLFREAN